MTAAASSLAAASRNATINRELAWLKQMFTLAIDAGKLMGRPKIAMLPENNARQGFFEPEQFQSVMRHLPEDLRPPVQFAYITGWRLKSEVLTREWRHIDLKAGTVCLEPGEAKKQGTTHVRVDDGVALPAGKAAGPTRSLQETTNGLASFRNHKAPRTSRTKD